MVGWSVAKAGSVELESAIILSLFRANERGLPASWHRWRGSPPLPSRTTDADEREMSTTTPPRRRRARCTGAHAPLSRAPLLAQHAREIIVTKGYEDPLPLSKTDEGFWEPSGARSRSVRPPRIAVSSSLVLVSRPSSVHRLFLGGAHRPRTFRWGTASSLLTGRSPSPPARGESERRRRSPAFDSNDRGRGVRDASPALSS